jgi:rod shape-determining protein MreD
MKKTLFFIVIFYLLALAQSSFMSYFGIFGKYLNFSLLLAIIINLYENKKEKTGIILALTAGFFLDFYSKYFFGFYILTFVACAIFIKFFLKKYVRVPFREKF